MSPADISPITSGIAGLTASTVAGFALLLFTAGIGIFAWRRRS